MRTFFRSISATWVRFKIYVKLVYVYPQKEKFKRTKSILPSSLSIGDGVVIEESVLISSALKNIGDQVYIGRGAYLGSCSEIGKFTSISFDVKIGLGSHPLNHVSTSPAFYAPRRGWVKESKYNETGAGAAVIGSDVLISANAIVLAGIKVGHGAVIGAGAVVNKDVPPYAVVVGVPARVIRYRFSEQMIQRLLASHWWDADTALLRQCSDLADDPERFLDKLEQLKKS